jgi:hypothetical protein
MRKLSNTILLILMFQFGANKILAQRKVSAEATINHLNELLKGNEELSIQGKYLVIKGYSKGSQSKEDKVNRYDLDPERIKFLPDEGVITMKCFSDVDGCIERKSLLVEKKAYRNRVAFSVSDEEHGVKVAKALIHLVNCFADKKYVGPDKLN